MTTAPGRKASAAAGIARSLRIYYRDAGRDARMTNLYARFVTAGSLVFDIGAHVGDRILAFRKLGCRVVALEPQPAAFRALRLLYGRDRDVTLIQAAADAASGRLRLCINTANPTVSTASQAFIAAAQAGAATWQGQVWDETVEVQAASCGDLIARYGMPDFIKIDVEGFEDRVLAGLSQAPPHLSFEFTTLQRDVALRCLTKLDALGRYVFNASLGETHVLQFSDFVARMELQAWLMSLPNNANSGDVYASHL